MQAKAGVAVGTVSMKGKGENAHGYGPYSDARECARGLGLIGITCIGDYAGPPFAFAVHIELIST